MNPPPEPQPRQRRYSARHQARLDEETHAKLAELVRTFQRKRAAILRYVMQWGLTHTKSWTVNPSIPASAHLVPLLVTPELLQRRQDAADQHEARVAAWLRQALRQVTLADFPASWRARETAPRSHESGYFHRKFGLRLDDKTSRKLVVLTTTFHRPAADVIRQLILQAQPEDFPQSWHLARDERREGDPS
jgi:predicted transcriptional regulator